MNKIKWDSEQGFTLTMSKEEAELLKRQLDYQLRPREFFNYVTLFIANTYLDMKQITEREVDNKLEVGETV
jgi:hypothetical protein